MENSKKLSVDDIKKIETDFKNEVESALKVAKQAPKGGGDEWFALLRNHEIQPLTDEIRGQVSMQIPTMTSGAYPFEVRMVLDKIFNKYKEITKNLNNDKYIKDHFELNDALYDVNFYLTRRFDVDFEINKYYSMIKAPVTLNNIFANASSSLNIYSSNLKESRSDTLRCKSCGAPRLKENQYDFCVFCGSNLFSKTNRYE